MKQNKITKTAKNKSCVKCGVNDGTVVYAHYNGEFSHMFGKGIGAKVNDIVGAHLCYNCHTEFDTHQDSNKAARNAYFLALCFKTLIRNLENGDLTLT